VAATSPLDGSMVFDNIGIQREGKSVWPILIGQLVDDRR
jgi:hypothetical protein